ncbi:NYN domain-containing protein [Neptuniibacter sp. QD37_11]|uniref:NYN domain-containing protein n=1 Tax=Neptuniibacter sp. QD37_11 TaxID=3398209 RepID=UPI0039F4E24C
MKTNKNKKNDAKNIALYIDAENVHHGNLEDVMASLRELGTIKVSRAFADWNHPRMRKSFGAMSEFGIRPVHQPNYRHAKNTADIAIIIDAMRTTYEADIDALAIVSSDSDFIPLLEDCSRRGFHTLLFCEEHAIHALQTTPDTLHILTKSSNNTNGSADKNRALYSLILNVVSKLQQKQREDWIPAHMVGEKLREEHNICYESYGVRNVIELLKRTKGLDCRRGSNNHMLVSLSTDCIVPSWPNEDQLRTKSNSNSIVSIS